MNWLGRDHVIRAKGGEPLGGDDLWIRCLHCKEIIFKGELERRLYVCPKCNYHFKIPYNSRLSFLLDEGSFEELFKEVISSDPLKFKDIKKYSERLKEARQITGLKEAIICGKGSILGQPTMLAILESGFMGGSMGSAVGEKIVRIIESAFEEHCPLVVFSASGGARMQEGLFALMQMAKTSAALMKLRSSSLPFISVLTDPTTGGVAASFAMMGDIIIAEPKAMVGFAGPRVIEKTIGEKLPEGFQRAEFLLKHGMIDMIVERKDQRETVGRILELLRSI